MYVLSQFAQNNSRNVNYDKGFCQHNIDAIIHAKRLWMFFKLGKKWLITFRLLNLSRLSLCLFLCLHLSHAVTVKTMCEYYDHLREH